MRTLFMSPKATAAHKARIREKLECRCLDCLFQTEMRSDNADECYNVHDALWLSANPAGKGMLCIGCLEERIGRPLVPSDFTDDPNNGWHEGSSQRLVSRLTGRPEGTALKAMKLKARLRVKRKKLDAPVSSSDVATTIMPNGKTLRYCTREEFATFGKFFHADSKCTFGEMIDSGHMTVEWAIANLIVPSD